MRYAKIGGQAVMEGVMMRFGDKYAVAVRKPDQTIEVKTDVYDSLVSKFHMKNVPIIRGMFAFVDSLVLGMSTLTYSASFFEDEEEDGKASESSKGKEKEEKTAQDGNDKAGNAAEDSKDKAVNAAEDSKDKAGNAAEGSKEKAEKDTETEKKVSEVKEEDPKAKEDKTFGIMMAATVAFSIVISVLLFMLTPYFISTLFGKVIKSSLILAAIEGLIRIAIFLAYMILISRMKDIQRVFMYHGAEHKTISCIEAGMELTPENAAKCSRLHKRCGTSFLLIVMIVSIICFMFIRTDSRVMRLVLRLILIPVIAGISFEIIQFAGRHDSKIMDLLSAPGLMLQKYLTTREPDESMLEVAIASIEAIYDWRAFQAGQESEEN